MPQQAKCSAMQNSDLGKDLDTSDCVALITAMNVHEFTNGDVLVNEGDLDHTLFILTEGAITVNSTISGKETTMYTMKVGECAGTRAFLDLAPRQATLKAQGDTTVYTLTPEDFEGLLDTHPKVVYKFMRGLFRLTHKNLMRMNAESQHLSNYIVKTRGRY
ncbi:MAG: cyclic nucleotide-binding domain-containing protein [Gammaproteobacteria bacterium]|nr:cyclic nucleotide-binding domain-containing protein [Gammaproteobacteria bacterium]